MTGVLFVTDPLAGLHSDIDAGIGLMSATQDLGLDVWCCGLGLGHELGPGSALPR